MLTYVFLFYSLFGYLQGAVGPRCVNIEARKMTEDIISKAVECPCDETPGFRGDHRQDECNCFEVPKNESNCNLKCFVTGVQKYKEFLTVEKEKMFANRFERYETLFKRCNLSKILCYHPCPENENVTATVFWKRLERSFQNINNYLRH